MTIRIRIVADPMDPFRVLADASAAIRSVQCGACASFIGNVRRDDGAVPLHSLYLEHYPGMTEREIEGVCDEVQARWNTQHIEVWHRIGQLHPGDPIVVVGVWSEHRASAFDACRSVISFLKERAPIWKREQFDKNYQWVTKNTRDPEVGN